MEGITANRNILLTGFDLFGIHTDVNASWEVVKGLDGEELGELKVCVRKLPVVYSDVAEMVPRLWQEVRPALCVHVGVGRSGQVCVERRARRGPYVRLDNDGSHPATEEAAAAAAGCGDALEVATSLDVDRLVEACRLAAPGLPCEPSTDAGLFLCEYSYFTSLNLDRTRSLFVHVPPIDQPASLATLVRAVRAIVTAAATQVRVGSQDATSR